MSKMIKMASDWRIRPPDLREADKLERARNALLSNICRLEDEYTAASMLESISEAKIEQFLRGNAENRGSLSRETFKEFLSNVTDQAIPAPATHACRIDYGMVINLADKMASPRGFEPLLPG